MSGIKHIPFQLYLFIFNLVSVLGVCGYFMISVSTSPELFKMSFIILIAPNVSIRMIKHQMGKPDKQR